jgi:[ribosomal protein S5]-alanine N-acetyltransferase
MLNAICKEAYGVKILETERLLLRPFTLDDLDGLYQEIYSDSEVVRYYSHKGVLTREATLQHLTEHLASWRDGELGRHAVVLKENGAFLGQVHLNAYVNSIARWIAEPSPTYNLVEVELAFAFGRRSWGQGYAFEACTALIHYAFSDLSLQRLVGGFFGPNTRSRNLHQRLGFHIEPNLNPTDAGNYIAILNNFLK